MVGSEDDQPVMLTEEGVSQVELQEHPGGWVEFGYDASKDHAERGR